MKLQITAIDNEAVLLLPEEMLRWLGVGAGDLVDVNDNGDGSFRIANSDPASDRAMRIAPDAVIEYRDALKALGDD